MGPTVVHGSGRTIWWAWALVVAIVIGTAAIRLRIVDVPLDRDEGEYAYVGQLLLNGIPPYAHAYNMKMPGIYALYAVILGLFGQTPAGVHFGLVVANGLAIVLLFVLARRLFDSTVAAAATASFAALAMSPAVLGLAGYAEHFVVIAVLAATLLLLRALDREDLIRFVASGILFGVAFTIKQSGGLFLGFAVLYTLVKSPERPRRPGPAVRRVGALLGGALLPFVLTCVVIAAAGTFPKFWFWTFRYASEYVRTTPLEAGVSKFVTAAREILRASWGFAVAAALGVSALFWDDALRCRRFDMVAFFAFSFLAVTPGLYFRPQYFVLLLPAVALLAGVAPVAVNRLIRVRHPRAALAISIALAVIPPLHTLWVDRRVLLQATPVAVSRHVYGLNPFPEAIEVANYIRQRTSPRETIVVLGSEPEIYFYARRPAATGYIYMYPLVENHPYASAMQQQMIREVESSRPTFVVLVRGSTSWLASANSETALVQWFPGYLEGFQRVGVIDILSADVTRYYWDEASIGYSPKSNVWLAVFRRKQS